MLHITREDDNEAMATSQLEPVVSLGGKDSSTLAAVFVCQTKEIMNVNKQIFNISTKPICHQPARFSPIPGGCVRVRHSHILCTCVGAW